MSTSFRFPRPTRLHAGLAAAALALVVAAPAVAQSAAPAVTISSVGAADPSVQHVLVTPPGSTVATPDSAAMRDLQQAYGLSNGRRLTVTSYGDILRVRYGHRGTRTLRFDGQGQYVSADGRLALQLLVDEFGDARDVRLTMPADWL